MARDPRTIEQRRDAILNVTADLIVEFGYAGTSLDAIVELAGCSKSVIYSYFGDKQGLLSALAEEVVHELSRVLRASDETHLNIEQALIAHAKKIMELVLSDKYICVLRAIISEFWNTPKLGLSYHKLGPKAAQQELSEYLDKHAKQGGLIITDAMRAAQDLLSLVLLDKLHARLVGVARPYSAAEIDSGTKAAVESFLKIYSA